MPLPAWCAAIAIAAGLLVLLGWAADVETLKRISPALVAMNPTTAVLFVLAGASLWLQRPHATGVTTGHARAQHRIARLLAGLVVVTAALKLGGALLGWGPGVDQWLFADKLAGAEGGRPNRMAPNTALNFLLLGLALILLDVTTIRGRRPSEYLVALVALGALMALLGHAYRGDSMYGEPRPFPMTPYTGALFLLLAFGVLSARPRSGLMAVFTAPSLGGIMARRLLPGLVVSAAAIGWLRLEGERRGLYGTEVGVTLYTVTVIALITILVAWSAVSLHRTEAARRQMEEERERFFAMTPDMLCIAGLDGVFRTLNPAWERLLGYTREELLGRPFMEFVHPDDHAATVAAMGSLVDGVAVHSFENRYCRKQGDYRWFEWNAIPVVSGGLIYATARDITERKQAEHCILALNAELGANAMQLQQSNRELEAFSYSISHDLRAPLRHIDGYARMLQEDAGELLDPDMRRYLDTISDSARQMGALIDDLLAFSRLGRKPVERTEVDMHALVERVVDEVGGGSRVSVGPLPAVHADPVLLRQVWVNLLSNALKYSAPRGDAARIEVSGERMDGVTRYRVRDNGVGFDMRYADKLFGVFQRLHSQEEFEGTGVGLAIVRRIVTRHGGTIGAEAEPGRGATFTFELPIGAHDAVDGQDAVAVPATEAPA